MKIAGIEISHPDKVLFPKEGYTKKDMLEYYDRIAERMLPYLKNRPLSLQRFPDGISKDGFFQKNAGEYFPDFIERINIPTKEGTNEQVFCNTKKSLIYLANQGTVTFHTWLSRKDKLHKPDKVVFDLDPPANSFNRVKEATQKVGDFLREKERDTHLMASGKKGFHIWYKIRRTRDFDDVRAEARKIAEELSEKYPDLMTTETSIKKRGNKIFVDYLRNAYAQTSVCPYSLRPIESAGIATPLSWDELYRIKSADQYNLSNIFRRVTQLKD